MKINRSELEITMVTREGKSLHFRPALADDRPHIEAFWDHLSKQTIYNRFFSYEPSVPAYILPGPDSAGDCRDTTLLALKVQDREEYIQGMANLFCGRDTEEAETAVMVGDAWQREGIGITLMILILMIAKKHGIRKVWGHVLGTNSAMLRIARKLGFMITREGEDRICEITMYL